MRTRFAPSPTGYLHLGHAFSAMECARLAEEHGGEVLLRFEDIDFTRVRAEYYEAIIEDLNWIGIQYMDVPWRQLDRMGVYQKALEDLVSRGLVYPCFCTRKDLAEHAIDAPQGDRAPVYSGHCRGLSDAEVDQKMQAGVPYAWRLDSAKAYAETGALSFTDAYLGEVKVDPCLLGDVVIARKDIQTSYHIAVVVDDAEQEVTHIVRGEDLLESTHVHRLLQALWGYPEPQYYHHRLVCDDQGKRLAKRHQSLALRELKDQGMTSAEVLKNFDV